jgi:TRAP transporter 4TM/12TM fusion protein
LTRPDQGKGKQTQLLVGLAGVAGAVVLALPVLWALDPLRQMRSRFVGDQFLAAELGAALAWVFWACAARRRGAGRAGLAVAGVLAIGAAAFLFRHFGGDTALFIAPTPVLTAVAIGVTGLVAVALVLTSGVPTFWLLVGVLLMGYLAQFLPAPFDAPSLRADRYGVYLVFGGNGFLGGSLRVIAGTVVIYILFGAAYEVSGGTAAIDALARVVSRRGKGVAIKATVVSSALFGLVSGSATSNVLTSGTFTILGMRRIGVSSPMAGGIEAVSSTMGQVTPPVMGAAAFIMADLTGIPYGSIALAAAVPALICFVLMFHQATWLGRQIEGKAAPALRPDEEARFQAQQHDLGWRDLWHLGPMLVISILMFWGDRMTELAGIGGIASALVVGVGLHGPREVWSRAATVGAETMRAAAGLVVAGSALGVIVGVLAMTGLDVSLTLAIRHLGETSVFLSLVLTAVAALLLGTGMATTGVYVIVGTLLAPSLVALGVPVIAAHLFVLYFGMVSMITPPVAFAALAASGISGASFSATAWAAMRFGWMIYVVPFLFVYAPELVLVGPGPQVLAVLAGVFAALVAVGALVAGLSRPGLIIAGLALCLAGVPVGWPGIGGGAAALAVGGALAMTAAAWHLGRPPRRGE